MNQAYKEALAIVVRQLLITLGTAIGVGDLLTPYLGDITNYVVGGILVLVAALWSQFSQRFKRSKLMQALQAADATEQRIEGMVKSTMIPTPPVTTPTNEVPATLPPAGTL